jgi:hypothetical protein
MYGLLSAVLTPEAVAHDLDDSYVRITVDAHSAVSGQWDFPATAVVPAAAGGLKLSDGKEPCRISWSAPRPERHKDRAYVARSFTASCPTAALRAVDVEWSYASSFDHNDRALVAFKSPGGEQAVVLDRFNHSVKLGIVGATPFAHFWMYVRDGVFHIWTGVDHALFLLTLILPSVFRLVGQAWRARDNFRDTGIDVLKTVSAFTVAHSLTLCLVTFHVLHLPARFVEAVIALSVLLAALNNLFPVLAEGRWKMAFLFGLVHGIGFAEVLADLELPTTTLITSLLGFNVGVELGQIGVVALALPAAFAFRRTAFYRQIVFSGGSAAISLVATLWLVDRIFRLGLMPF